MATGVTNEDNRAYLFRLQKLIIDGGILLLRNILDQKLNDIDITLGACLNKEMATISRLRRCKIITQVQYDILFPACKIVPTTSDLDISLLICLLRNLRCFGLNKKFDWNATPSSTDVSLEADIWRLQTYRNSICQMSTLTGIQQIYFTTWWNDIEQILVRQSPSENIQQTIDYFKTCSLNVKEEKRIQKEVKKWEGYEAEVNGLQDERTKMKENIWQFITWPYQRITYHRMKKELQEKLIKFYNRKRSTVTLSPLVEEKETNLARFYVMPDMVYIKKTSLTSDLEERTPVESLKDLLITGSENQQEIYLSADAGFGKTAFSKYLAVTWCQTICPDSNRSYFKDKEIEALANFDFLFLILLRDTTAVCTIDEMIEQQTVKSLPWLESEFPLREILHRERCLIILDGLDEWTHPDNGCSDQSEKIPHRYAYDNCVILTTTRPWKLGVSNLKTSDINKRVELVQLNKDSTYQLERNAIRKMSGIGNDDELEEKTREFDKEIASRGLEHMQTIPLLLMYITCLWCNKIPIGNSKLEVYINIIEFLLSRTAQKHPEVHPSSESSHSDIPEYFKKHNFCEKFYSLLTALAELAYHTLFNEERENTLVFDGSVAEKHLEADDMKLSLLSGILTGSTTTTLIERKSKVSFSHKIVQEFFAAIFISSQSDAQKTVVEKCKNIQCILDMSMIYEFLSKMNSKMTCEILADLMSVINEDEETRKYRTRTDGMYRNISSKPLFNIQKMFLSCFQQMTGSENIKLCLQDFFIDEDTIDDKHLQRLSKLNNTQIKSLYIDTRGTSSSFIDIIKSFCLTDLNNLHQLYYHGDSLWCAKWTNDERKVCETLKTLKYVQYLYIRWLTLSHEMLEIFYNFISGNKSIKQLTLRGLSCIEHGDRGCKTILNLYKNFRLKDVYLQHINLDESSLLLSRDMLNIERVVLSYIEIYGECLQIMVENMETMSHLVTVEMSDIKPETEYERVRSYIRSSQTFNVTRDDSKFEFQTRKPSKE